METEKLLTVADVQKLLTVSRMQTYKIMRRPDFPLLRIGKLYRVRAADLERWLTAQGVAPR